MIEIQEIQDKNEWEEFLATHPEASFLQSWYWGDFYLALGSKIHRTGFYRDNQLIGVMLSIVEDARRGRYLAVPGGPIIDWADKQLIDLVFGEIQKITKEEKCVFARVRPQLEASQSAKKIFADYGLRDAPIHLHAELTSQLDITRPEEEILAGMRKTTRYEIKKAQSLDIRIKVISDPETIKDFYDIQLQTAGRQGFIPFSYKFIHEQFKVFAGANKALLYSAGFQDKTNILTSDVNILAQAMIIFYGDEAVYHYGASTEDGRKYPGAYLIQWEAIKEAKRRGMKRYNFWGVSDPNDKGHRFYGISIFKRGFGGKDFEYLHAKDLVIDYPKYVFNYVIETARKRLRNV